MLIFLLFTFSLVSFSLSSFSFIMSSSWSKNDNKNNNRNNNCQDEKKKKGKKIYFLHPPLPPDNPPPPSVGKKVAKVWLFYLRVWWFRNLNTCIPVWQRRKTESSVSEYFLNVTRPIVKRALVRRKEGTTQRAEVSLLHGLSVAWLVCLRPVRGQKSHANDFVNAKNHAREKPLLAG